MANQFEIERKFLIKYPDTEMLLSLPECRKIEILQTYVAGGVRLRKWTQDGKTTYIKTVKLRLTDLTRIEKEEEIEKADYEELIKTANEGSSSIEKVRYRYPYEGKLLEIDVFPFWKKQAFLEIELEREDEEFSVPSFLEIIKEVTSDKRYRNFALSKQIPDEEI